MSLPTPNDNAINSSGAISFSLLKSTLGPYDTSPIRFSDFIVETLGSIGQGSNVGSFRGKRLPNPVLLISDNVKTTSSEYKDAPSSITLSEPYAFKKYNHREFKTTDLNFKFLSSRYGSSFVNVDVDSQILPVLENNGNGTTSTNVIFSDKAVTTTLAVRKRNGFLVNYSSNINSSVQVSPMSITLGLPLQSTQAQSTNTQHGRHGHQAHENANHSYHNHHDNRVIPSNGSGGSRNVISNHQANPSNESADNQTVHHHNSPSANHHNRDHGHHANAQVGGIHTNGATRYRGPFHHNTPAVHNHQNHGTYHHNTQANHQNHSHITHHHHQNHSLVYKRSHATASLVQNNSDLTLNSHYTLTSSIDTSSAGSCSLERNLVSVSNRFASTDYTSACTSRYKLTASFTSPLWKSSSQVSSGLAGVDLA